MFDQGRGTYIPRRLWLSGHFLLIAILLFLDFGKVVLAVGSFARLVPITLACFLTGSRYVVFGLHQPPVVGLEFRGLLFCLDLLRWPKLAFAVWTTKEAGVLDSDDPASAKNT